jgi:hypothetical protein
MNYHLKISSRFSVLSFLLALNFVFFSNFSYGNIDCDQNEKIKKQIETIINKKYDSEYEKIKKISNIQSNNSTFYNNIIEIVKSSKKNCLSKLCNGFKGIEPSYNSLKCRSLPTNYPWNSTQAEWNLEFKRSDLLTQITIKNAEELIKKDNAQKEERCSDRESALKEIKSYSKDLDEEQVKAALGEKKCFVSICKMIKLNYSYVKCGDEIFNRTKLDQLLDTQRLKNQSEVNDGKNLSKCTWATKLPRRVTTGCGACVGYVICNAPSVSGSEIKTMRLATCKPENCQENSAQDCVNDLSVGSRKPDDPDNKTDNVIRDTNIINAVGQ